MGKNRTKILASVVVAVAVAAILVGVLTWHFSRDSSVLTVGPSTNRLLLNLKDSTLELKNQRDETVLETTFGVRGEYQTCDGKISDSSLCVQWETGVKIEVKPSTAQNCHDVSWTITKWGVDAVENCFSMKGAHWYGAAQVFNQFWPIEKWDAKLAPFVTGDSYNDVYGDVMERYFVSSKGVALFVDRDAPLFVSVNESASKLLCFVGNWTRPYVRPVVGYPVETLLYKMCVQDDVRKMQDFAVKHLLPRPTETPDERMIRDPIWSTWAQYKKAINQSTVLQFADAIVANNFSHSQLEIDDDWTPKYGDLDFNTAKFQDAKQMIVDLKQKGFRVTVWIHPFKNLDSAAFFEAGLRGYLVKDYGGKLPALTSWWDGLVAGILDVTNPNATTWFKQKLSTLQTKYGVDSFKFDAGETNWLPALYLLNVSYKNPDDYSRYYVKMAYEADTNVRIQEVRVGAPGTQKYPIFVRMLDKDSVWGYNNGLKTVIPDALTFGILGFPFVLPDMIGGNAYNGSLEDLAYPERELYIRWLQVNAFLPSWQFSIVPWQYDDEVVKIAQDVLKLRAEYADVIVKLAREAARTGAPIIRPLWWIAPNDTTAQQSDDEFLLGNDILVAPVVYKKPNRSPSLPYPSHCSSVVGGIVVVYA